MLLIDSENANSNFGGCEAGVALKYMTEEGLGVIPEVCCAYRQQVPCPGSSQGQIGLTGGFSLRDLSETKKQIIQFCNVCNCNTTTTTTTSRKGRVSIFVVG